MEILQEFIKREIIQTREIKLDTCGSFAIVHKKRNNSKRPLNPHKSFKKHQMSVKVLLKEVHN